jgi:hypothetical protein
MPAAPNRSTNLPMSCSAHPEDAACTIRLCRTGDWIRVVVEGDVDADSVPRLAMVLGKAAQRQMSVVVDLAAVTSLATVTAHVLVRAREAGADLLIIPPKAPAIAGSAALRDVLPPAA